MGNNELWMHWGVAIFTVIGVGMLGLLLHWLLFRVLDAIDHHTSIVFDNALISHGRKPTRLLLPLLAILFVLPLLPLSEIVVSKLRHLVGLGVVAAVAWALIAVSDVVSDVLAERYRIDVSNNLRARRVRTQFEVLRRIFVALVILVAGAVMLMTFPAIRNFGASILASAGLAGLAAGLAARPMLANFIAGIQIALTEPIRLDDVVVVEGEYGRIEEIGTSFVVVRTWDLRRLVVPLSRFLEQPFENWTRRNADILGTIFLYVDYTVPVEELRQEFKRIVSESKMWDGIVANLQVTNMTEQTVELRALVSAGDSSTAWDLRCHVREQLLAFLRREFPQSLPRLRGEITSNPVRM
ncbi:MAG: mechanosensitive ion channel [Caldilineaceae bacterium]|nr:mechanosensitive ion channel family protein [Caldilineaceae bacterium]